MRVLQEYVVHPHESLRYHRFERAAFEVAYHRHRQLELTWIERGTGLRFVGDNVAPFLAGDLVLIGAEVPHCWVSSHQGRSHRAVATVVQFPRELLELLALPELRRARPVAAQAQRGLAISGACRVAVIRVLKSMRASDPFERLAALVRILGLLCNQDAELRPIATGPTPAQRLTQRPDRVERVLAWIHAHIAGPLRVAEAARIARMAPDSFSRFFHREFGKPFRTYVLDVRCSDACLKLRQSKKTIAAIAHECGFTNISHFNRQFRQRFGVAPRDYRGSRTVRK